MAQLTGGQALARQLKAEGVGTIFGLPGLQLDFATDGLVREAPEIGFVVPRHEQTTTYMADGYARATEGVGVAMVVPGPGMLNGLAGLSTAYACNSRVLYIVGQIQSDLIGRDLGFLHEIPDQTGILRSLTKWCGFAHAPEEVPGVIREAFRQLWSGRPRPVAVEIPPDVLAASADIAISQIPAPEAPPRLDQAALQQIAEALATARQPVIFAGQGVEASCAQAAVQAVAERLNAPVITSWWGRSAFDDRHRLALHRNPGATYLREADVVLVVGSRFVDRRSRPVSVNPAARIYAINIEPADLASPRHYTFTIAADARQALDNLLTLLPATTTAMDPMPRLRQLRDQFTAACAMLEPQHAWLRAIRGALPDDAMVVNDLTQIGFAAELIYETRGPRGFVTAGYQGTLGFAFPTALGLKMGAPHRAVLAITGDGGFGYALQELATARRYRIGVITVVFNDGWFGNVRRIQNEQFAGRIIGAELTNPDFQALGRAFGVHTEVATTPDALAEIIARRCELAEPTLIEVPMGQVPSPWPLIRDV